MNESALFAIAAIGVLGVLCQWIAWRVKLPAILFLLVVGILLGPITGWLNPDRLFGNLLFPLVSLAVAVILFEGSLTLRLGEIRGLERVVRNLVSFGLLVSGTVTAVAAHWLVGLDWPLAALFGAMMTVTGPTVIIPMLRTVRPNAAVSKALRWEGIVIDPIGALLAVVIYEFIISSQGANAVGHLIETFALILFVGGTLGVLAGYLLGLLLRHYLIPEYLHNVATLSTVFAVFAGADMLAPESGLLAVTVMGMWLANMKRIPVEAILDFKESLSMFFISGLFIILAARLNLGQMMQIGWGALGVLVVLQLVSRPLKVWLSTLGSPLTGRERVLLAWIGPRGIIAAAVSALFALRLSELGYQDANRLVPLTFLVIIGTVVLQSLTARPFARFLGIAEPEPRGLLIVGANPVARAIGRALQKRGFHVILADSYWEHVKSARMDGLSTYYGNPVSEHADRHLDLIGIGRLLGLSPQGDLNVLAAQYYRRELGQQSVYTLPTSSENEQRRHKHTVAAEFRGRPLFGDDASYRKLQSLVSQGAEIRATTLTENFAHEDWLKKHGGRALPLFAITPKGELRVFTADSETRPGADWTILALTLPPEVEGETAADDAASA
ncbi:sodium:proton antiporter [Acidihalobacter yilgarnensis]|uniref:Sodium:proton antiporter n=1 Tax=Acidihalobacter yilgarnensis TaxID=2819280 RepID=A0A1D8IJQ0_9GAMM|nr:sodium:proton antiporter [Acidihalobacter yilgarnensis]AOU96709.1 sodium:proton antiporter [Acidihalobacter yilgarnensis]